MNGSYRALDATLDFDFRDVVCTVATASVAQDLPFPTGIYENHPGTGYIVIHYATAEDAAKWCEFFKVTGHRAEPSWWAWGWFGWTVELAVAPRADATPDHRCQWGNYTDDGECTDRCGEQIIPDRIYCQTHADVADDIRDQMADAEGAYVRR